MKPRIGFFDFTGCEGCQLAVLNLEEQLLDVIELVEVVEFREVQQADAAPLDIAFVEGSICRADEEKRLRQVRERSKVLVALGACADLAGINALHGDGTSRSLVREVYGTDSDHLQAGPSRAVAEVVTVDYRIPGCPIDGQEFLSVLQALLLEREPELPGYAVCVECKLAELPCTFEQGVVCLGPVTRAGCRAVCIEGGDRCRGCRGLVDNPRDDSYQRVLLEFNRSVEEIMAEYRIYNLRAKKTS